MFESRKWRHQCEEAIRKPLVTAVIDGNVEVVNLLLDQGTAIDAMNGNESTVARRRGKQCRYRRNPAGQREAPVSTFAQNCWNQGGRYGFSMPVAHADRL